MTTTTIFDNGLIDRLPPVHGRYAENVDLSRVHLVSRRRSAEVVFRPRDMDDLATFLIAKPADVPVTVLGVGSNLLVVGGGVPGWRSAWVAISRNLGRWRGSDRGRQRLG